MMQLTFSGWVEARLATDPDPSDDPWGVSGYAVGFPGEPPLDRVVQTNSRKAVKRKLSPKIGVTVHKVEIDGKSQSRHPLLKSSFNLLESPVLEGRNDLVAPDTIEPIFPVVIELKKGQLVIRRELRHLDTGEYKSVRAPGVVRRNDLLAESGVGDPKTFLTKRIYNIEKLLEQKKLTERDRSQYEYLLEELQRIVDRGGSNTGGPVPMFLGMTWHYVFEGPWWSVSGPKGAVSRGLEGSPWVMDSWMGCWDADVLCAYYHGTLQLPYRAS